MLERKRPKTFNHEAESRGDEGAGRRVRSRIKGCCSTMFSFGLRVMVEYGDEERKNHYICENGVKQHFE